MNLHSKWKMTNLADCARIVSGATPKTSEPRYWDGDIWWVTPKDISDLDGYPFLDSTPRTLTAEGLASCSAEMLPPGSVLFSSRAPIGLVAINRIPVATNQGLKSFVPDASRLNAGFLYHWLRANRAVLENLGTGATFKEVSKTVMTRVEIPLPPLGEQKRIAAVLDHADVLCRQRQESFLLIEKFLQSVFINMFIRNPDAATWTPRSIDWMARDEKGAIRTGPFGSQLLHSEFVDSGIAVLGIDNAVMNRFEWGQPRFITPEKFQGLKRYKVFPGDLIITIMGTLGRCAIVPQDIPEAINTKHLCCITLDPKKCIPEFLHAALLNHPGVHRQLGVRTKGAVMPGLNMGIIKDLELPLPPIELQERFKRIVALCTISRTDIEDSQALVDRLFRSIQQRAFRGELNLSRLKLEGEAEATAVTPIPEPVVTVGRYKRPGSFSAPPDIEAQLLALEAELDAGPGETIPWSEDYFKYRTLSQLLTPPYSFSEIWEKVIYDMEDSRYEVVKEKTFEYLAQGILEQKFDAERNEIVFYPRP